MDLKCSFVSQTPLVVTIMKIITMNNDEDKACWPEYFPSELELPPVDAIDATGIMYRFVKVVPPTEKCFQATHLEQPRRHETCDTLEKKQAVYGTSVWDNKEMLLEAVAALPNGLGKRKLVCGTINASMGKMRKTLGTSGHFTLWLRKNSNIHLSFSEVE